MTNGGLITDNTIDQSGNDGISVQPGGNGGSVVARNVITRTSLFGMTLFNASYSGNTLVSSNASGIQVIGGVNMGQNLCGAAVCP